MRRRTLRILWYAFVGWFFGLVLMHILQFAGQTQTPEQENVCLLTGFLLGLLAYAFTILWTAIGCAGNTAVCERCPQEGRWQRFCNNHRLTACLMMFWAVGVAFLLAHLAFVIFGWTIYQVLDHGLKFLVWLVGLAAAALHALFGRAAR